MKSEEVNKLFEQAFHSVCEQVSGEVIEDAMNQVEGFSEQEVAGMKLVAKEVFIQAFRAGIICGSKLATAR